MANVNLMHEKTCMIPIIFHFGSLVRAFAVCKHSIWNQLPEELTSAESLDVFNALISAALQPLTSTVKLFFTCFNQFQATRDVYIVYQHCNNAESSSLALEQKKKGKLEKT